MNATMLAGCVMTVLVAVAFATITASPLLYDGTDPRMRIKQHQERLKLFPCRDPQNRTYVITDLLSDGLKSEEVMIPRYTVIRTCDSGTGICGGNNCTCGPKETETENVEVKVISALKSDNKTAGRYLRLEIQHHKSCHCQVKPKTNVSIGPTVTLHDDVPR